jgi:chromosome segregation ATPase
MENPGSGVSGDEYRALYEKLVLANRLFEEREGLSHRKLALVKEELERTQRKCLEYRSVIKTQRKMRLVFEQDVQSLTRAADMLDQRERDVECKYLAVSEQNADLATRLEKKTVEAQRLSTQVEELRRDLRELEENSVSLETHRKLQRKVEEETVPLDVHRDVLAKCERLQTKLDSSCVPLDEHLALKSLLQQALEDRRLVDESCRFFDEERHAAALAVREAESRCGVANSRANAAELELRESVGRCHELGEALEEARGEARDARAAVAELSQKIISLEGDKASALTQLGALKIAQRRDADEHRQRAKQLEESKRQASIAAELKLQLAEQAAVLERESGRLRLALQRQDAAEAALRKAEETSRLQHEAVSEQLRSAQAELEQFKQELALEPLLLEETGLDLGLSLGLGQGQGHGSSPLLKSGDGGNSAFLSPASASASASGSGSAPSSAPSSAQHRLPSFRLSASSSPPETSRSPLLVSPHPPYPSAPQSKAASAEH